MVEQGGVLFLDLSLSVGWAYGTLACLEAGPEWGVWLLPKAPDPGLRGVAFENELCAAIDAFQPAVVGIEAALPASQQSNAATAHLLIGLDFLADTIVKRWSRRFTKRSVNDLRRDVCGRSQRRSDEADDRISVKDAIVRPWIEARGWQISDHNARDAAVGWAFEMGIRAEKPRRLL